ncbi:MAG: hypothetical protein HQL59_09520, partial [Magnetococcales bacterium]|nr:hypothetical protein [Magnetococcales bacterium]
MTPHEIPFPHLSDPAAREHLTNLLARSWEPRDAPIALEVLRPLLSGPGSGETGGGKKVRLLWQGEEPLDKALLRLLVDTLPEIEIVGHLVEHRSAAGILRGNAATSWSPQADPRWDRILLANPAQADAWAVRLEALGVAPDRILRPHANPLYQALSAPRHEARKRTFLASATGSPSPMNRRLLFIVLHRGSMPSVEYLAQALAERPGVTTAALYLFTPPPEGLFHLTFHCQGSLRLMLEIVAAWPAGVVYLQAHFRWVFLSQALLAVNDRLQVVQEVYDWFEAFMKDPAAAAAEKLWSPAEMEAILLSERFVRHHLPAFLYKSGGQWMERSA